MQVQQLLNEQAGLNVLNQQPDFLGLAGKNCPRPNAIMINEDTLQAFTQMFPECVRNGKVNLLHPVVNGKVKDGAAVHLYYYPTEEDD